MYYWLALADFILYIQSMKAKLVDLGEPQAIKPDAIIEVCLCHHVRRAARCFTRAFDHAMQPCGLNYSKFNMLAVISALGPVPMPRVADYMAVDRTTLSRNIKPLKRAGYVESRDGAGRRPDIVNLTHAGHIILAEGSTLWRAAQSDLTRRLGLRRAGQLLEILEDPLPAN